MEKIVKKLLMFCVFCFGVNSFCVCQNKYSFDFYSNSKETVLSYEDEESVVKYAKVLQDCVLYKTDNMSSEFDNIYFIVPETYFVIVLQNVSENCLQVQYDKYIGFVESSKVEIASFVPIVKFLENITFDIKSTSGTQIWQYPTTSSLVYTTLNLGTKGIKYIGSVYGIVPTGGKSNIWYYVQYIPEINSTNVYEGYIYSENTTNLSEIVSNKESNPEVILEEIENEKIFYISSTLKTIVISIIAIPIILFFAIILYKIIKKIRKNTKYNNNSISDNDIQNDELIKSKNIKSIEKFKNLRLVKNKNLTQKFDDINDDELL